jgi:hypothetical protein
MIDRDRQARWKRAPTSRRGTREAYVNTTGRQVTARITRTRETIAACQAELAALADLREDMRLAGAHTVGDLSADARARHSEPIGATAGALGGVEMW